jgi:hypothetical protein
VAAFSSRPAAAFALGKGYALAGAGCRERRTLHDRGWRVSGALVDAAAKLSLAAAQEIDRTAVHTTSLVNQSRPRIIQLVLALDCLGSRLESLSHGDQALGNVVVL